MTENEGWGKSDLLTEILCWCEDQGSFMTVVDYSHSSKFILIINTARGIIFVINSILPFKQWKWCGKAWCRKVLLLAFLWEIYKVWEKTKTGVDLWTHQAGNCYKKDKWAVCDMLSACIKENCISHIRFYIRDFLKCVNRQAFWFLRSP